MNGRPPISTRTYTPFPYTTLCRSVGLPLPEGLETLARVHQPEGRRRNSRSWLRRAMTTAINERVVMRHGSPVVIRKVVTGGYWHDNGLGRRGGYAPRQITLYVRLGRWRESVLTVPRAMKIAERPLDRKSVV